MASRVCRASSDGVLSEASSVASRHATRRQSERAILESVVRCCMAARCTALRGREIDDTDNVTRALGAGHENAARGLRWADRADQVPFTRDGRIQRCALNAPQIEDPFETPRVTSQCDLRFPAPTSTTCPASRMIQRCRGRYSGGPAGCDIVGAYNDIYLSAIDQRGSLRTLTARQRGRLELYMCEGWK